MQNASDWLVGGLLLLAIIFVIRYLWRAKKQGKCAGGCGDCRGCSIGEDIQEKAEKGAQDVRDEL